MIVTCNLLPGKRLRSATVPAGRYEGGSLAAYPCTWNNLKAQEIDAFPYGRRSSHRTYGTGPLLNRYVAINCQAKIIPSLRDKDARDRLIVHRPPLITYHFSPITFTRRMPPPTASPG